MSAEPAHVCNHLNRYAIVATKSVRRCRQNISATAQRQDASVLGSYDSWCRPLVTRSVRTLIFALVLHGVVGTIYFTSDAPGEFSRLLLAQEVAPAQPPAEAAENKKADAPKSTGTAEKKGGPKTPFDVNSDKRSPDQYKTPRQWSSRSGKVVGEGVFLNVQDGSARIKLGNGKVGRLPVDKLSQQDQEFIKNAIAASEESFDSKKEGSGPPVGASSPADRAPDKPMLASDKLGVTQADAEPVVAQAQPNASVSAIRPRSWSDSISNKPELEARVVLAIDRVLGASSNTFSGNVFKGIRLGDAYDTTAVPENARIVCDWPAPAAAVNQAGGRDAEVTVLVARDTGKIVGISAYYRVPFHEMVGDVIAVFGKTPQQPETFKVFAGNVPLTITVAKYTFPKSIVRVISRENARGSLGVSINVFDKEFVLDGLRRYASAVAISCEWLAAAVEDVADSDRPLDEISALADCVADPDAQSRLLLLFDQQQRGGYRLGHREKDFGPYAPRAFDVAGVFKTADAAVAIVDPMVSWSLAMPQLCSRDVDPQGLPCTIASTVAVDLFWDVASSLVQSRFPPADENISIIRPHPDGPDGLVARMANRSTSLIVSLNPDESPAKRMQVMERRVSGDRYEWMDKNSYLVRVGSNLAVSIAKPLQKPRRGL